jgi:hypothetical protein
MNRRDRVRSRIAGGTLQAGDESLAGPRSARVDLHIEQLTLRGFNARDTDAVGAAIQLALSRMFLREGIPQTLRVAGAYDRLATPPVSLHSSGAGAGEPIARALYSGLMRPVELASRDSARQPR